MKSLYLLTATLLLLFTPLHIHAISYDPSSLAEKRLSHSSIIELLRFINAFPSSTSREELQKKATLIFLEEAGGTKSLELWQKASKEDREFIYQLLLDASSLLMADTLASSNALISQYADVRQEHDRSHNWELYLSLTHQLKNRELDGFTTTTKNEVLETKRDQVDLFRAISIEYNKNSSRPSQYTLFEVTLDLIAIDAKYRTKRAHQDELKSTEAVIDSINTILFQELHIRFPPLSTSEKYIDQFSNIEEILLSKRGVCLGVSSIYIALLQRVGIKPIIYTPPGHIFIAVDSPHRPGSERIIETTARGIHLPLTRYLDSRIAQVPRRDIKEVVGMILMNDAARWIKEENFVKSSQLYERAAPYFTSQDADFLSFWSFVSLLSRNDGLARSLAKKALAQQASWSLDGLPLAYDISRGLLLYDQAKLLVESMNGKSDMDRETLLRKINAILEKTPEARIPVTILELKADICLKEMDSQEALNSLKILYTRWRHSQEHVASFIGLPTLLLLSQIQASRSNIEEAISYLKESYLFISRKQKASSMSINPPKEMQELIWFLSQKSPYSLKGIRLSFQDGG